MVDITYAVPGFQHGLALCIQSNERTGARIPTSFVDDVGTRYDEGCVCETGRNARLATARQGREDDGLVSRRISNRARPNGLQDSCSPHRSNDPRLLQLMRNVTALHSARPHHSRSHAAPHRRYRREAVVASSHPSSVVAYAIASVFTPHRHRRKGYASHLMRLLHFVLADPALLPPFPVASWGEPPTIPPNARFPYATAIASALYSDVGATFYRLCGPGLATDAAASDRAWIVHDPFSTLWPVADPETLSDDVRWMPERALWDVWDRDAAAIRREICGAGDDDDDDDEAFAFTPTDGVARFLLERSRYAIPPVAGEVMWGAQIAMPACPHFATWALDPGRSGPSTLVITRLRASPSTLGKLLNAARKVAVDLGLEQIEVWNLDPGLQRCAEELGGRTARRGGDDHLPSLAWYRGGEVVWKFNEKFSWC